MDNLLHKLYHWFEDHDKLSHFLICFLATVFGVGFSIAVAITIEAMQIKHFGWKEREFDTVVDLIFDALGIVSFLTLTTLLT